MEKSIENEAEQIASKVEDDIMVRDIIKELDSSLRSNPKLAGNPVSTPAKVKGFDKIRNPEKFGL